MDSLKAPAIECYRDNFDSQMLGCEAWKLWLYQPVDCHAVSTSLEGKAADAVFCFTVFDHGNFRALQALGFELISVRNTYEMALPAVQAAAVQAVAAAPTTLGSDITLARASAARERIRPADLAVLADVIGATSRYYKDHRIAREKSQAVYRTWLNNSVFNGYAVDSALAFEGERLIGIHSIKVKNGVGVIDLIGVAPEWQSAGLGRALLADGIEIMREHGATRVEVTTENENVAGSRFYQKYGFRLASMQVVWHKVNSA